MRISGNYVDRVRYVIFPMAMICGFICAIFSAHPLQAFLWLGGIIFFVIWLLDTAFIFQKFGMNLNKLFLTDTILFNDTEIQPSQIVTIKTENIYPDSIISKWRISTICLTLNDGSVLHILAKPHSLFFYLNYFAGIFSNYYKDRSRAKSGLQRGFAPLSTYFVRETSQTLDLLTVRYPELKLKSI